MSFFRATRRTRKTFLLPAPKTALSAVFVQSEFISVWENGWPLWRGKQKEVPGFLLQETSVGCESVQEPVTVSIVLGWLSECLFLKRTPSLVHESYKFRTRVLGSGTAREEDWADLWCGRDGWKKIACSAEPSFTGERMQAKGQEPKQEEAD